MLPRSGINLERNSTMHIAYELCKRSVLLYTYIMFVTINVNRA